MRYIHRYIWVWKCDVSQPKSDDDEDESHGFMEDFDDAEATNQSNDMDEDEEDQSFFNQTCFRARADTVHSSLYHKLPTPYINLGEWYYLMDLQHYIIPVHAL